MLASLCFIDSLKVRNGRNSPRKRLACFLTPPTIFQSPMEETWRPERATAANQVSFITRARCEMAPKCARPHVVIVR